MMMTKTIMIKGSSEQSNFFPLYEDLTMVVRGQASSHRFTAVFRVSLAFSIAKPFY